MQPLKFGGDYQITETIVNDDSASIAVEALVGSVKEGTLGGNTLVYRITRNCYVSDDLTVNYSLAMDPQKPWGVPLPDNAVVGGLTGTVKILAGQEYVDLELLTMPDAIPRRDLPFLLSISADGFADPTPVTGTIMDDDSGISVAFEDANISEGGVITLHFTRGGTSLLPTDVAWDLVARGKESVGKNDFADQLNGTVSFDYGETEKTVTITLDDDTMVENTETFVVRLLSSSDANQKLLTSEIQGAILDNDAVTADGDLIVMGLGSSRIEGLGGDDQIFGGGGADAIFGGDGNDTLVAGMQTLLSGDPDALIGSAQLYGGNGNDFLVIGSAGLVGNSFPTGLFGGEGFDTVTVDMNKTNQTFDLRQMARQGSFDSIEMVNMRSTVPSPMNTLALSAQAMAGQGVDFLFDLDKGLGGGLHQLVIFGFTGNTVSLMDFADWTKAEVSIELTLPTSEDPGSFNVYTNLAAQTQIIVSTDIEVTLGQIHIALDATGAWDDRNHNGLRDDGATDLDLVHSVEHPGLFTIEGISFIDDDVELRFTGQFDTELDMTGAADGNTVLIDVVTDAGGWFNHPSNAVYDHIEGAVPQVLAVLSDAPDYIGYTMEVSKDDNTDVIQIGLVTDPSDYVQMIPYHGLHLASYVADTVEISYVHTQIT